MGYADIENKTEFSKDSVFTLYSLSKPFCAIGLMKLKDKNLVDIDKHPGVYLSEAKGFDKAVTISYIICALIIECVSGMSYDNTIVVDLSERLWYNSRQQ